MAIRLAAISDVPALLEIYRPYVTQTAVSFEYDAPSISEFTQRFEHICTQFPWLIWEENREILGYAYGSPAFERKAYAWCADLSIYLKANACRRGIGRLLYTQLESLLAQQGYRVLYALVTTANTASLAFHKAMGYRETAFLPHCGWKFGQWHGVVWLEKDINPEIPPQGFPIPFAKLQNQL